MMSGGNYTTIDGQRVSGSVPAVPDPGHVAVKFEGIRFYFCWDVPTVAIESVLQCPYLLCGWPPVEINKLLLLLSESNLQQFPPSQSKGKLYGGSGPPRDADDTLSKSGVGYDDPQQTGWFSMFNVATYKPYFDVDTPDVLERIKESLFPFGGNFNEKTASNPDLYGPFWICTTLIFVAASIGTFVTYISHKLKNEDWNYDVNFLTWSAGLFYGYVTVVPLALYVALKYFSASASLVQLLCLYGYSLFIFVPALCLSVVPSEIFQWVVAGIAGFMSATFVALNLKAHIDSAGETWFMIVAAIFLLQLALAVALKMYVLTFTV